MFPVLLLVVRGMFWARQVALHVHTLALLGCRVSTSKTLDVFSMFMDTPQIWFIRERLCMCLQRTLTNRWLCVWQWKENPSLSEAQVQGMALARQAAIDMELKHREAVYRDILNKQQTVISVLYTVYYFLIYFYSFLP